MKKWIISIVLTVLVAFLFLVVLVKSNPKLQSYIQIKLSQIFLNKCQLYPQKNVVNIVAITDSHYIIPLSVTIYSAIKNKNKNSKYHFYIIGIDLNQCEIRELSKQSTDDTLITIIQNKNIYDFPPFTHSTHVTITDCFKFNIPDIFPNFDKMLYLDGDIIVQKDLSDLYNTNMQNKYAAVYLFDYEEKKLGLKKYFNNGVMLLNLKKMRKDNIPDKLLRKKLQIESILITQDVFNAVFGSNVKKIDHTYNTCTNFINVNDYRDINKFLQSSAIIHYAGPKPWNDSNILYASTWKKYHSEFMKKNH